MTKIVITGDLEKPKLLKWYYRNELFLPSSAEYQEQGLLWYRPTRDFVEADCPHFENKFEAKTFIDDLYRGK